MGAIGDGAGDWGAGDWRADGWGVGALAPTFGFGRERRLHARAHAHWAALCRGRAMPAFADLDPGDLAPFAEGCVLIERAHPHGASGWEAPALSFLGRALRDQAGLAPAWPDPADVPEASLLGTLLGFLPTMIAAAAPLGFQGEHADGPDAIGFHRGILLPLAGEDGTLAAVLGVMTWRTIVVQPGADILTALESDVAIRTAPPLLPRPWGDRLSAGPVAAAIAAAWPSGRASAADRR